MATAGLFAISFFVAKLQSSKTYVSYKTTVEPKLQSS